MAISRSQLVKELEPGLNALFGLEYKRYENQHAEIYTNESSDRAFEEEVMLSGFGNAQVKGEGAGVSFDDAQETYTARYSHETVALAFAITEEAIEDNLYDRLSARYTKALARSMSNAKQVKAVELLINGLPSTATLKVSFCIGNFLFFESIKFQLSLSIITLYGLYKLQSILLKTVLPLRTDISCSLEYPPIRTATFFFIKIMFY